MINKHISIIIGFVDEKQELLDSLKSIQNQSKLFLEKVEVIIMSKHSISFSFIGNKYTFNIKIITPPLNGLYVGLNYVSSLLSETSLLWFFGAGDCVVEGDKVLNSIFHNRNYLIYAFSVQLKNQDGVNLKLFKPTFSPFYGKINSTLHHQGLLISNKLLRKYPYSKKCKVYADFQFSLLCSLDQSICSYNPQIISSSFWLGGISTQASLSLRVKEYAAIRHNILTPTSCIIFTSMHIILLLMLKIKHLTTGFIK